MKKNKQNEKPIDHKNLIKKKDMVLKSLVESALDFIEHSTSNLKDHPKHSVINFHAAVELFLKARLMAEHWSLVVANNNKSPDLIKFVGGNFISVSLEEAILKLKHTVCDSLADEESDSFKKVAIHRNKMAHFFSGAYTAHEKDELHQAIAIEQLVAWHFLKTILLERWKDIFKPWIPQIKAIDIKMSKHKKYLEALFKKLEVDIKELKKKDFEFKKCSSCGFESQKHEPTPNKVYDAECMVCGFNERALKLECPVCKKSVYFLGEGYSKCSCSKEFGSDDVVSVLHDKAASYHAAKNGDYSLPANCCDCDTHESVVYLDDYGYFCCNCFEVFEDLFLCDFCSKSNTREFEDSFISGCIACKGANVFADMIPRNYSLP